MSKKLFLNRSFADVVRGSGEVQEEYSIMYIEDSEGVPGESRITPDMCFFKYKPTEKPAAPVETKTYRKGKKSRLSRKHSGQLYHSDSDVEFVTCSIVKPEVLVISSTTTDSSTTDHDDLPTITRRPTKKLKQERLDSEDEHGVLVW